MLRPFLVFLLVLASVSSTNLSGTIWTKKDQDLEIACPMPDDGEKLQVCSWRNGDEGEFISSFEKSNVNRISTKQNNTNCMIRIERVEEEDEGIWECKVHYQNKDGEAALFQNKIVVEVVDVPLQLNLSMPKDGEKIQVCSWRSGDKGAFKSSFKKSHGDRISVYQNKTTCSLRIYRVEEEDLGIWQGKVAYLRLGSSVEITKESTVGLKSSMKGSSMEKISTTKVEGSSWETEKRSTADPKSSKKGPSMEKLSSTKVEGSSQKTVKISTADPKETLEKLSATNSTLDNKSQKHSPLKKSSREGLSSEKLSNNRTALIKIDKKATNLTSVNINSGTVKEHKLADWVSGILFFGVAAFLETYETLTKNVPFDFAFSLALSPSAAAGPAKTGELGIAIGSNGDIMFFGSRCLGVKADLSLELDLVVGAWTSINDITGENYAIGLGVDSVNFQNELGTEESGGNFEVLFNSERLIGGTLSVGRGVGYELPIDSEVNFEKCHTVELTRLAWKNF